MYCNNCHIRINFLKRYVSKMVQFYLLILKQKIEENKQHLPYTFISKEKM